MFICANFWLLAIDKQRVECVLKPVRDSPHINITFYVYIYLDIVHGVLSQKCFYFVCRKRIKSQSACVAYQAAV